MNKTPTTLIIMDGFGLSNDTVGNAVRAANTPVLDGLFAEYAHTTLQASGLDVGLPAGQMGNSEVGHTNIGGGRVVFQDLPRITRSIEDGTFFENPAYNKAMDDCLEKGSALHLYGLHSTGGVHSTLDHLYALLKMAHIKGLKRVYIHAFLDGRDTPPTSGRDFVAKTMEKCRELGVGKIATVMGRYYAMDRDKRWDRLENAYDALVYGEGVQDSDPIHAIEESYKNGVTDEFVEPIVCDKDGMISDNDSVIFFNYRPDRAREITRAFVDPAFDGFKREFFPLTYVCNTEYDATMPNVLVAFPRISVKNGLGEYLSKMGMTQLRIAETEKYAHVTFFFNGGVEEPYPGEDRVLVASPKVATYDLQPEMSAYEVAEDMRADGIKVLAVAYSTTSADWDDLVLCGFLGFFDRPKASARAAVQALSNLSVEVRVLTGDSASVARSTCSRLGIPADSVITGSMLQAMEESEALIRVGKARVFAELTPAQKAQIVSLIRLSGHIVGYIGDGVNDVPALTSADVGIVVDSAAAESKKVADLVLLERDLGVVAEGVSEGRTSFANASKYIRIASSSNFGNICSVAASSIFLPFVPATATQLLLLNLCYDATCLALSWDNVDDAEIARPRAWSGKGLGSFMLHFGFASSAFDIITFAILFLGVCPAVCGAPFAALDAAGRAAFIATFQAGWLLECAWTESLVLLVLRTRSVRDGDRPCTPLVVMVAVMLVVTALLALSPVAQLFGLATLPVWYLGIVALLSVLYLVVASTIKRVYLSRSSSLF